jgi:CheY-like chemotaxis protein
MSELLHRTLGETCQVETVLGGGLWRANADPNQLEAALLNLAVNGRDAMPDGGRLTLETANTYLDEAYVIEAGDGLSAGQYVMIAVTDTGSGMDAETVARAFDPFFTTKPPGKGTGLGLSQVYGFVKQSGGHVRIYSEPGRGTTIRLYLPRGFDTAAEIPTLPTVRTAAAGGGETLLLVEDEPGVRRFGAETLRELGYTVLEAADAAAALRLLDGHAEIALLLTDVVLPDIDGRRLAEQALRRRPDLPVLFATGYTRNAIVHNGMLDRDVRVLIKPFTVDQLATAVRHALESRVVTTS